MQQRDYIALALMALVGALFVWIAVAALIKARRRRRLELQEEAAPEALPEAELQPGVLAEEEEEAEEEEREAHEAPAAAPPLLARQVAEPVVAPPAPPPTPVAEVEVPAAVAEPVVDDALRHGLAKTSASLMGRLNQIFRRHTRVDPAVLDELEEVLLTADVGVGLAMRFIEDLRAMLKAKELESVDAVRSALKERMLAALAASNGKSGDPLHITQRPRVILFVGVNGVGKTTTIGKIASQLQGQGLKVLLAAGDTFRAAAAEQLGIWGERSGAKVIRGAEGADPASVIFNAVEHATQTDIDIVLADTAGRLHTKQDLMEEIKKVKRAAGKAREGAPDETWLVVDATTGQNALQQAREFHQALGLTGVILTKLDGTAKGGVVVAIVDALKIPVRFVGVGEKAEDLRPFNPHGFVSALFDSA